MAAAVSRTNITDKVTGQIGDGEMVLYYNGKPIGRVDIFGSGQLEVTGDYTVEGGQIYSLATPGENEQYAHSCDMGWC